MASIFGLFFTCIVIFLVLILLIGIFAYSRLRNVMDDRLRAFKEEYNRGFKKKTFEKSKATKSDKDTKTTVEDAEYREIR